MWPASSPRYCRFTGTIAAPSRASATHVNGNSARLVIITATRSPAATPGRPARRRAPQIGGRRPRRSRTRRGRTSRRSDPAIQAGRPVDGGTEVLHPGPSEGAPAGSPTGSLPERLGHGLRPPRSPWSRSRHPPHARTRPARSSPPRGRAATWPAPERCRGLRGEPLRQFQCRLLVRPGGDDPVHQPEVRCASSADRCSPRNSSSFARTRPTVRGAVRRSRRSHSARRPPRGTRIGRPGPPRPGRTPGRTRRPHRARTRGRRR